jgi:hypothetical protein
MPSDQQDQFHQDDPYFQTLPGFAQESHYETQPILPPSDWKPREGVWGAGESEPSLTAPTEIHPPVSRSRQRIFVMVLATLLGLGILGIIIIIITQRVGGGDATAMQPTTTISGEHRSPIVVATTTPRPPTVTAVLGTPTMTLSVSPTPITAPTASPLVATATFTPTATATLTPGQLTPSTIAINGTCGSTGVYDPINFMNSGQQTLMWSISANTSLPTGVTADFSSGTLAGGATQTVHLSGTITPTPPATFSFIIQDSVSLATLSTVTVTCTP